MLNTFLTPQTVRRMNGTRLAWFRASPDVTFWDRHWMPEVRAWHFTKGSVDCLGHLAVMARFLPRAGKIVEAGCGVAYYVAALRALGYDVEGVEWGARTVEDVRRLNPDLPVRVGDVIRLDATDGHYAGYISLGVMEHRAQGPEPFLKEACRVLSPDGVALISVPWIHALRRIKAYVGRYDGNPLGLEFYQYAFRRSDFEACLRTAGFEVIERFPYDGRKGVKDEIELIRKALGWPRIGWRLDRWLSTSEWVRRHFGHMMLFVCRKKRSLATGCNP